MHTQNLSLQFDRIITQTIQAEWLTKNQIALDVLRLDRLHDVISGNKWFKLQYYLNEAQLSKSSTIATFGGAFSNHIVATAFACKVLGFQSIGFIRGEKSEPYSITLHQAEQYGMNLIFLSRSEYKQKEKIAESFSHADWYWIAEGGYGVAGAKGAESILGYSNAPCYSHILASVGTGTMLAGLINSSLSSQHVTGISSMKGNLQLEKKIQDLLCGKAAPASFDLLHNYHFGGYAKYTPELTDYIKETYRQHNLPLDFVYTGKLFFAIEDLIKNNYFPGGSSLLMIHSGGLQGNSSLHKGALSFL